MQKLTVIIDTDKANDDSWKQYVLDEYFDFIKINSSSNTHLWMDSALESFKNTNSTHLLIITNPEIITERFTKYVKFASKKLKNVDFFQVAGGSKIDFLKFNYFRNYRTVALVILLKYLPLALLRIAYRLFMGLPMNSSQKKLIVEVAQRHYNNVMTLGSDNVYLSNVANWYHLRPPIKAFFLNENWLLALNHLQKKAILDMERTHVALARSANYNAASKYYLY